MHHDFGFGTGSGGAVGQNVVRLPNNLFEDTERKSKAVRGCLGRQRSGYDDRTPRYGAIVR